MQEFVNDNMAEPLETNRQTRLELARILHYILRLLQSDYIDENIIDSVQYRLDWVYNTVVRYADLHVIDERVVRCIQLAKNCLQVDSSEGCSRFTVVRHMFNGEKGRPRLQIPLEHLRFLLEKKFKVAEIANLFGSSKRTVERRMKDFGLSAATTYTQLSDQQLDELIRDIQRDFPNAGCKRVTGLLRARDVYMQQARIRQSMRRVDPEGILLRALELNTIRRRQYSVAGPLSLWHIDGNHKLIRYVVGGERRINVTAFHRVISLLIGRIEQRNSSTYKSSYSTILVLIL